MTESDKLIIYGIISILFIAILMVITAILFEKKMKNNKVKWLSYAIIFFLGVIICLIFPMETRNGRIVDLSLGTVIGLSISVFTFITAIVVDFINYEARIGKRMIDNAIRFGKELNLHTNGIPTEKNVHFSKLGFSWSGKLDNRWDIFHNDITKFIPRRSLTDKRPDIEKSYYQYKVRATQNTDTVVKIMTNIELNKFNFVEYETITTPYSDLNEKVLIYIKSGKEKFLKKLEDESFRKILMENYLHLMEGLDTNSEQGIIHLTRQKGHPKFGFFSDNYKLEMDYHIANKKVHLQFLKEFMEYFDN